MEYFNHPFEHDNGIKLIDDIEFDKPVSLESLSTKFEGVDDGKRGKTNAVERESKDGNSDKKKKKSSFDDEEFEPFDFDKAENF